MSKLPVELEQTIHDRWAEYGFESSYLNAEKREALTLAELSKILPEV